MALLQDQDPDHLGKHPNDSLLHKDPFGFEQGKRDEPDDRRGGDQQRVADLPTEEDHEADQGDEGGEPVTDGDPPEQDAGAEDGADGGRVRALDERTRVPRARTVSGRAWARNEC